MKFSLLLWLWHHKRISAGILFLLILGFIFRPKPPVVIPTQVVKRTDFVQRLSVSGTVVAKKSVNLTFPVAGKVVYIGAQKGDAVKQYQTIAALDQRTIEANIESAVKSAQNDQISFDIVNDKNGDRDLSDTGLSVSARRELQTALNTLDEATIAVEIQKLAKEQAFLLSPIDGILTRADVQTPGVVASLTTTYTVVDPTSVVLDMDVDQSDIGTIQSGQKAVIVFDAYPSETITQPVTSIDFVSHATTNGGNAFTVETQLPENISYKYRVGMTANADIIISEKPNTLTVPLSSITDDNSVFVRTQKGFVKRNIVIGQQSDTDAQVLKGLSEGDVIALDPTLAQKQQVK